MARIFYLDRKTKKVEEEKVYGKFFVEIAYGDKKGTGLLKKWLLPLMTKFHGFSRLYGKSQKLKSTKKR